jgi:aerobic-type carbon monoxide dehydrogenase small subunit (CoxS/CutS family)
VKSKNGEAKLKIKLKINGTNQEIQASPHELVLDVLRREGYFGVKRGCQEGSCGSCVILVDGRPLKTCIMFIGQLQDRSVVTIEGIHTHDKPHVIEDLFVEEAGVQCGYCIPGMILSAKSLLDHNTNPSERDIKEAISGNICRCTGYVKQIKAIEKAASIMRGESQ